MGVKLRAFDGGKAEGRPTVVDLFCGAGGLSTGLEDAGWRTVAAVDQEEDCCKTLEASKAARISLRSNRGETYLRDTRIICSDVQSLSARDFRPDGESPRWRPDLLAGGPPCQPFSSAGLRLGLKDPRGKLFAEFVRLADELKPRFILFENVAGLVTARRPGGPPGSILELVQNSFEKIGYACRFALVNAADYGAAQRRIRLFMIGARSEALPDFPRPTHSITGAATLSLFDRTHPWRTLGQFLASFPPPDPSEFVRPSETRAREMAKLEPGTGVKAIGIVESQRPGGHWGYRQDSFLADPDMPSRTIRAASTPDFIRLPDRTLRRLTWRECAALQGFPEGWRFVGTVASRFRQIGNAVQGDVARAIGEELVKAATERRRARPVSAEWPASFHRRVKLAVMEENFNGASRAAAKQARTG